MNLSMAKTNINALAIAVEGAATSVTADAYKGVKADVMAVITDLVTKLNTSESIDGSQTWNDPHLCAIEVKAFTGTPTNAKVQSVIGVADSTAGAERKSAIIAIEMCLTGNSPRYQGAVINLVMTDPGRKAGEFKIDPTSLRCFTDIKSQGDFQLKMEDTSKPKLVADVSLILGPCYEKANVVNATELAAAT